MRNVFVLGLLLLPLIVFCQTGKEKYRDSLQQALENIRDLENEQRRTEVSKQKIEILCLLSKAYDGIDSTKTFDLAFEALETSKKINYPKGKADANFTLGRAFMYIDPQQAIDYLEKGNVLAERLIEEDSSRSVMELWASGTYNLGLTFGYVGKHQAELRLTEQVIPVVERLKDSLFLANIYTNLGVKHLNLSNHGEAHKNLLYGRAIYTALDNPPEMTFNIIQLAMAYEGLDSLKQMKNALEEADILLKKYPNIFDTFNYGLQKSQYYVRTEQPDKALQALDSIAVFVQNDPSSVQYGLVMQRYSKAYEIMGDLENAADYISKFIANAERMQSDMSWFRGLYKRSELLAAKNEYQNAYNDLKIAIDMYDSLETIETVAQLEELSLKYETAEKEKQILELQVKNEAKKSQAYLLAGLASVLALSLFIAFYAYGQKLRKAKKKELIQQAEVQLLKQEQQNRIFSAMIEGQEKERKRLAIDLHDGLGGRLSGISLNLSKLDKDEPKKYPKEKLRKVMKDLDDSLGELRSIARNMMPETLVKFGLQAALQDYCSSMTGNDTKVTLQFYGSEKDINLNQQVTMYRVIQELINNAVKHADASEVLVQYMREANTVDITVEDNGVGLSKDIDSNENSGMGLSNLRTRVAYLKGDLDFHSEENEGTTVNVHLTLDSNAA